jgi:hypothetical protein
MTLAPIAIVALACGKSNSRPSTVMDEELKRDLKAAAQAPTFSINPDEIAPQSRQQLALKPKKAPDGPTAIRAKHPTVKASAAPVEAAEVEAEIPQIQVTASSPTPSETPTSTTESPPLARPAAVPLPSAGTGQGQASDGSGGILDGIFGAIIRGGVVDGDHCDPRGAGRPARGPVIVNTGGVYTPTPIGGMGGGRVILGGGRRRP